MSPPSCRTAPSRYQILYHAHPVMSTLGFRFPVMRRSPDHPPWTPLLPAIIMPHSLILSLLHNPRWRFNVITGTRRAHRWFPQPFPAGSAFPVVSAEPDRNILSVTIHSRPFATGMCACIPGSAEERIINEMRTQWFALQAFLSFFPGILSRTGSSCAAACRCC